MRSRRGCSRPISNPFRSRFVASVADLPTAVAAWTPIIARVLPFSKHSSPALAPLVSVLEPSRCNVATTDDRSRSETAHGAEDPEEYFFPGPQWRLQRDVIVKRCGRVRGDRGRGRGRPGVLGGRWRVRFGGRVCVAAYGCGGG